MRILTSKSAAEVQATEGASMARFQYAVWTLTIFGIGVGAMMMANAADSGKTVAAFGQVIQRVRTVNRVVILSNPHDQSMIAVSPAMQGRVLTTTASGRNGRSFGWVNEDLILSRQVKEHFNAYGGEDRVWIGPEGGQFSVFFAPHEPFDLVHWFTPAPLDTEPFEVVSESKDAITLRKTFDLLNYSGTHFHVSVEREIATLPDRAIWRDLKLKDIPGLKLVGFQSHNTLTNIGHAVWRKETGLLSLWIIGEFPASDETTIVMPIREGSEAQLGKPVTSDYFGTVPDSRLSVRPNAIFFRGDGHYRSKIGVGPLRAKGILGSYDAVSHVLTLVQYTMQPHARDYVKNAWHIQRHPFAGDVENAYNDGPPPSGGPQLGHFYELESLSPAAALYPGQSIEHIQRTFHFDGNEDQLNKVATAVLGVSLSEIQNALPR